MRNSRDASRQSSCDSQVATRTSEVSPIEGAAESWSFDTIYEHYRAPIYRYLVGLVTSPMQAEDLTQEVFVRVLRTHALPRLSAEFNVSAWLYRIARNIAIDVLRRCRLVAWASLEAEVIEQEGTASLDPQARYDGFSEEVLLALARMPAKTREVLVLYELEGASYAHIAQRTHIASGGVKMSLTRARKKFKQHYQDVRNEVEV